MKVTFLPTQQTIEIQPEETLLSAAQKNQIPIRSLCKGEAICAECRVKVVEGENNILPPKKAEITTIGSSYYIDQRRLACQIRCFGNITVDLTEQLQKQDLQNKKIRGAGKKGAPTESHAIIDTMLLNEKFKDPSPTSDGENK